MATSQEIIKEIIGKSLLLKIGKRSIGLSYTREDKFGGGGSNPFGNVAE